MQRTTSGLRRTLTGLDELERQHPEWHTWLRLLGEVERALDADGWYTPLQDSQPTGASRPAADTPLLYGRTIRIDAARFARLISGLAATASEDVDSGGASLRRYRPSASEALTLIAAAVRQDEAGIAGVAAKGGLDARALASVTHLAAIPLLRSFGRLLESELPSYWPHGYCPICAAWPILTERRGLDRSRRLRCGRCAAQWEIQWLCCVYCGERDHQLLGFLEPDAPGELPKVETCATCRGYLKSFATLQGIPAFELLLRDLETVELDLVALDRGYGRPEQSGFALEVRVV